MVTRKQYRIPIVILTLMALSLGSVTHATGDTFGAGANQFDIDFVTISGDASSANGTNISQYSPGESGYYTFSDPANFRIGKYEITRDQWHKFASGTGSTSHPARYISWLEVVQFVNYLNTSTGHQAAYKFVSDDFDVWEAGDAGYDPSNPYRNSNAHYFLPTEGEWVKAAYWNGTNLQTYATPDDSLPQGGEEANYEYAIGDY